MRAKISTDYHEFVKGVRLQIGVREAINGHDDVVDQQWIGCCPLSNIVETIIHLIKRPNTSKFSAQIVSNMILFPRMLLCVNILSLAPLWMLHINIEKWFTLFTGVIYFEWRVDSDWGYRRQDGVCASWTPVHHADSWRSNIGGLHWDFIRWASASFLGGCRMICFLICCGMRRS